MNRLEQGDILNVPSLHTAVIVVSRGFFNETGLTFVCPMVQNSSPHAMHIPVEGKRGAHGIALCEAMKALDFNKRHYSKTDEVRLVDMMNLSDAIQAIFDYYPAGGGPSH